MSKAKTKDKVQVQPDPIDTFTSTDQPEYWEMQDQNDQAFWEEFFQIEEILATTDELNPPSFSITVQNNQTGEVKTYAHVHLSSVKKKVIC